MGTYTTLAKQTEQAPVNQAPQRPELPPKRMQQEKAVSQELAREKQPEKPPGAITPSKQHEHKRHSKRSAAIRTIEQATRRSDAQSVNRPLDQWANRPIDRPVDPLLAGKVVDRPVAFYIPAIINEKIDEAVDYMEKRHRVKVDRSAVVSAILGNAALWEAESLNQLVDKVISQLTNRLTNRLIK